MLPRHKFEKHIGGATEYADLPEPESNVQGFWYMVKVCVDNFMSLAILVSKGQLRHVANAIMHSIHNIFPPDAVDSNDPILERKLKKGKGMYKTRKTLLGFDFEGKAKTMWLELEKHEKLLTVLKGWIHTGKQGSVGIPFGKFESTIAKIWHAFMSILAGRGLLAFQLITEAVPGLCLFTAEHTCPHGAGRLLDPPPRIDPRTNPMPGVGVRLARLHWNSQCIRSWGRGVIIGKLSACTPVVFQWEWPDDIK